MQKNDSKTRAFNVRIPLDLAEFVDNVKIGNASEVIRAAVWWLSLQDNTIDIVRSYGINYPKGVKRNENNLSSLSK